MNELFQWGGHPVVDRLGWTLLHFLWQGAVIAGLFAIAQTGWPRCSSNARYLTGCLALLLMLAAPLITFIALGAERTMPVALAASGTRLEKIPTNPPALVKPSSPFVPDVQDSPPHAAIPPNHNHNLNPNPSPSFKALHSEKFIPGFVLAWLLGVSALSLRLLFSSLHVARLKRRGSEPAGAPWMERLHHLQAALQISRPVRLVKSVLVEVPTVVGWLRPVILLPAATLTGLTPAQLESILAHELAHVRRHDYLVNLLQNALETLLFYHPAVWWVSSCVRAEREICCDEIAIQLCGDRLVYAQALTTMEELRAGRPSLALGADGGSLLERIRRLSGAPSGGSFPGRRRAGGALVAALVAIILVSLLHHPPNNAKALGAMDNGQLTMDNGGKPPAAANQTNVQTSIAPNSPDTWNTSHGLGLAGRDSVTVEAGEINRVTVGGTGRPVIGKLLFPSAITNGLTHPVIVSRGKRLEFLEAGATRATYSANVFLYSVGILSFAAIASDGTFRLEDVRPGTYGILAEIVNDRTNGGEAMTIAATGRTVVVPEMSRGRGNEPMDLGTVEPVMVHSPQIGEAAAFFEVKTENGGTFKLADHRGQYVLLDFEPMDWNDEQNEAVKAVWAAFGKNNRLAMLTLQVSPLGNFVYPAQLVATWPWPLTRLVKLRGYEQQPLRAGFGLQCDSSSESDTRLPAVFLIGPDGKIIARDLHGDDIKAAVAKALGAMENGQLTRDNGGKRSAATNPTNTIARPVNSSKSAMNPSGISLVIRCTNDVLKVGDEIPIQFIISNHGTVDWDYSFYFDVEHDTGGQFYRLYEYGLFAKTTSGENVPGPRMHMQLSNPGKSAHRVLRPGESISDVIPLNCWALVKDPGRYEVVGAYMRVIDELLDPGIPSIHSAPISITVLPRTEEEMNDYIIGLTNQIAATLAAKPLNNQVLKVLIKKLMYTCRPEIVPTLLRSMYATDSEDDWDHYWELEALLYYAPHTEETWQAILEAVARHGLNENMVDVLLRYYDDGDQKEMKLRPVIEQLLASGKPDDWLYGVNLASWVYSDDALTQKLVTLATNPNFGNRESAIFALALNRTDEGVKTLKILLNDPDPKVSKMAEEAIRHAYTSPGDARGRPLRTDDFDAKFKEPKPAKQP